MDLEKRTDWLGRDYGVGDYILYTTCSSSMSKMNLAKVISFETTMADGSELIKYYAPDGYVVVVQPLKVSYRWNTDRSGGKQVRLTSTKNITKIDWSPDAPKEKRT